MKINYLNYTPNITRNYSIKNNKQLLYTQNIDTVSFSAKNIRQKPLDPRVKEAVDFSTKINDLTLNNNLSFQTVSDIISQNVSDIKILPVEKLAELGINPKEYDAMFNVDFCNNFTTTNKRLYVNFPPQNANTKHLVTFLMNISHEYTHALQDKDNETFKALIGIAGENIEHINAINTITNCTFDYFDKQIKYSSVKSLTQSPEDRADLFKYRTIVPREGKASKQMVLANLGMTSEKEFNNFIKKSFEKSFEQTMKLANETPEIKDVIPHKDKPERFKKEVLRFCIYRAREEKEAYKTESEVARKFLNTNETLNIDIYPIYYEMLEKALTQ